MRQIRDKYERYIQLEVSELVKIYGKAMSALRNPSYRCDQLTRYVHKMKGLFNTISTTSAEILNGEFSLDEFGVKVPIYVILDFIYGLCVTSQITLDEKDKKFYEETINNARNLEFSSEFDKSWHINEEVFHGICTKDSVVHIKESKELVSNNTQSGVTYNSTTKNHNKFYNSGNINQEDCYDYLLNYNTNEYPELESNKIWQIIIQNQEDKNYILFREQATKLISDYKKIISYNKEIKRRDLVSILESYILPLYMDKSLNHFVLNANISWEDENHQKLAAVLETLFLKYESYKESHASETLESTLYDTDFLDYIKTEIEDALRIERKIKLKYSEDLSAYYQNIKRRKDISKETIQRRLDKLNLVELHTCIKKSNNRLFGKMYVRKFIESA